MTTLGRHPDALAVKLTLGDGAHLVASTSSAWAGPVTLHYGPKTGDPVISDVGTVDGDEVSWTLTEAEVTARAEHDWARLEDNGVTLAAGPVMTWLGGSGHTTTQTIASLTAGPPGPTAVSADAGNAAILGTDSLIYVGEAQIDAAVVEYLAENPPAPVPDADATTKGILRLTGDLGGTADSPTVPGLADKANTADLGTAAAADTGDFATAAQGALADTAVQPADLAPYATDADLSSHASDTTGVHGIADTSALVTDDDARLSDARTPTAHSHPTSDVTGLDAALAGKAATSHTHVIADTTGLQAALDGKAASSHTHTLSQVTDAGDSAGLDVGTTAGTVAAGDHTHTGVYQPAGSYAAASHTHELDDLDATGATDGHVLTADGAGGAAWEAPSGGGGGGGAGGSFYPVAVPGSYVFHARGLSPCSLAATAGEAWGYPFPSPPGVVIAQVGVYCSTGVGGESIRVAIYDADPVTGAPAGAPLADVTIAVTSSGYKYANVNATPTSGRIWVFICPTAASQTAQCWGHTASITVATPLALDSSAGVLRWPLVGNMAAGYATNPTLGSASGAQRPGFMLVY